MLNFLSNHCCRHCCGPFAADDSKSDRLRKLEDMALEHSGWRFDGATCLLTFHFVPREERVPMAAEIRRRLKPGAPLVVAHLSVANGEGAGCEGGARERDLWLSRYAAFQVASGAAPEHAARAREKVAAELAVLIPEDDEATLCEAGFSDVRMFYMGFAFRGVIPAHPCRSNRI